MNKTSLIRLAIVALALLAGVPAVQAQCSPGGYCALNPCPWYNHIADSTFSNSCPNWEFQGTAGVTTSNTMCGWYGNPVAYISRNFGATGGIIRQPFVTSSSLQDVYSFEYFIETTNMQAGDVVKVYIVDASVYPAQWYLVDTITTNVSCAKRTHWFTNPGWKGHSMHVRFEGNFASTATKAYIDYVSFWQKTQP